MMNVYVIYHKITGERLSQLILSKNDDSVLYGFREFVKNMKSFSPKTLQLRFIGYFDDDKCAFDTNCCYQVICNGESVESLIAEKESEEV